ncbi:transposase [Bifidobacterium callitrichos]|uniref:Transposase n=1 Tax=Bifidobacterium callitrichos TaxID=762209 RepID=A0A2T3GBL7_9BIFI|nr:transposase [Bifidobacterium callitrichos]
MKHWVFRASRSSIPKIVELSRKIRRRPDNLRTIEPGHSNGRLEVLDNRIRASIRMTYGFRRVNNLIALITLR